VELVSGNVEFSKRQLERLYPQTKVTFRVGNAEQLPLPSSTFDTALSNEVFCHVTDLDQALKECCRILKTSGKLAISDLISHKSKTSSSDFFYHYTKQVRVPDTLDRYVERLEEAGFLVDSRYDFTPNLRDSYQAALRRLSKNKNEIETKFGTDRFGEASQFYRSCLEPHFLEEMGWGIFICHKS
jgi:ubiquinone/menaquinone biosynthesis C-methylase UbiE